MSIPCLLSRKKVIHSLSVVRFWRRAWSRRLEPCEPWRELEQRRLELPVGEPQQEQAIEREQQPRFPRGSRPSSMSGADAPRGMDFPLHGTGFMPVPRFAPRAKTRRPAGAGRRASAERPGGAFSLGAWERRRRGGPAGRARTRLAGLALRSLGEAGRPRHVRPRRGRLQRDGFSNAVNAEPVGGVVDPGSVRPHRGRLQGGVAAASRRRTNAAGRRVHGSRLIPTPTGSRQRGAPSNHPR